ncbi:hypothetical protein GE061_015712 [Apolygus lucorum]|uniref:G-protein coupled receptors family 2 profile 2 domain-containing protein n=1 Tax=Apolygus lucorum TaxID=248454 RepID=A0A8S9XLX1_APOLU|nr:hypothetical protein GE061_015712 [Apolygus lucorum]
MLEDNATKQCFSNGSWANYTNYLPCLKISMPTTNYTVDSLPGTEITTLIYIFGYVASLVALFVAVWIFVYFKDLRCLRNTIHINLMCTYILADAMWIINAGVQMYLNTDNTSCNLLVFLLHYFHLTNFFWMFVEGLYLYMLVVETFTRENIKLRTYIALGWGVPFLVMLAWSITRWLIPNDVFVEVQSIVAAGTEMKGCPWMSQSSSDWIYNSAALLVLAVNLIFLIMIMWPDETIISHYECRTVFPM